MTIIRRNRLRRSIAATLAHRAGLDAEARHDAEVAAQPEGRHYTLCCVHAYEDAARTTYAWLTGPAFRSRTTGRVHLTIGVPQLQRMLAA